MSVPSLPSVGNGVKGSGPRGKRGLGPELENFGGPSRNVRPQKPQKRHAGPLSRRPNVCRPPRLETRTIITTCITSREQRRCGDQFLSTCNCRWHRIACRIRLATSLSLSLSLSLCRLAPFTKLLSAILTSSFSSPFFLVSVSVRRSKVACSIF